MQTNCLSKAPAINEPLGGLAPATITRREPFYGRLLELLDLDAPVLRTTGLGVVVRDRSRLAEAHGFDSRAVDSLAHEIALHRGCAPLGQRLVVAIGAYRVGVPL